MKLTKQEIHDALEKARRQREERDAHDPEARAATEALNEWPDGYPLEAGEEEQRRYEAALRRSHETHDLSWPEG
jgi:hypothetical protein